MHLKALIFDMDGLMIDSERLYFQTEREMADRFNKKVEDKTLWKMMGRNPIESMRIFVRELGLPISPEQILKMRDEIMRRKLSEDLRSMPGLGRIVGDFHEKLKLAVSTGAPKEFLDIVVDQLNIRNKFTVLQTSDDITNGKPNPEIYVTACQRLGLPPEECAVLEDSENGVIAGKKAGCYVVAIPTEYSRNQDFSCADFIASDLVHAAIHIRQLINS